MTFHSRLALYFGLQSSGMLGTARLKEELVQLRVLFCFFNRSWSHSPVLVPCMRKSSDEDELDEDEGKPSHHAHIMPSCRGEEEEGSVKSD